MVNRAAKFGNFLDQAAAEKAVFSGGGQKHRFDVIRQGFVGVGHLQLFFKV
jgi:nicotinate-nucleotide pyrophosphorylase